MQVLETHKTAASLFLTAAEERPRAAAIDTLDETITYAELKSRALTLAERIRSGADVGRDDGVAIVAILTEHGPAAIVGMLGALLGGRAYAPLDASQTADQLRRTLQVARAMTVVVDATTIDLARQVVGPRVDIVSIAEAGAAPAADRLHAAPAIAPEDPAYLMFTSGSTGEPKGVLHTHRSVMRSASLYAEDSALTAGDRVSLIMPVSYTPSVFCIFGALTTGATLCPLDVRAHGADGLQDWVRRSRVALLYTSPTVFRRWANARDPETPAGALRMVQLAGEPVLASDIELFKRAFPPPVTLYNGMGTSETSCLARCVFDHTMSFPHGRAPMGVAYDDVDILIRNADGRPLGHGEVGSLFVRGRDFAQGYWARPDLTAERFRQDPEHPDYWIYDTGDLATRLPDGRLMHCGRSGQHVSIGQIRVDPTEIESTLMGLDSVSEAAVLATTDEHGVVQLAAYVTAAPGYQPIPDGLRWRLSSLLPPSMIPAAITILDELPTIEAGKVDRAALLAVRAEPAAAPAAAEQARDDIDVLVLQAFRGALSDPNVGLADDFFALGGDSLQALDLTMRLQESLGVAMSASTLLKAPTPQNMAREIRKDMTAPQADNVIVFNAGAGADMEATPTLYCLPGIGGHSLQYRQLADRLGPRQRCFGLEFQGVDGRLPPLESVEAIAKYFEARIRRTTPSGPIALAAYCIGGMVAFELARRLSEAGREVAFVAMLHSLPPDSMRKEIKRAAREDRARRLREEGPVRVVTEIGRNLRDSAIRRFRPNIGLPPGVELPVKIQKVQDALTSAAQGFRAAPHAVDTLFFSAAESVNPAFDPVGEWRALCEGRLTVVDIPGHALELFKPPAVDIVAERLALRLGGERALAKIGEIGEAADPLGPLNELWGLNNADGLTCQILQSGELRDDVRAMVDHEQRMTRTLELRHGERIRLQVLGQQQIGRHFMRKIALKTVDGGRVAALAVIRIDMGVFEPPTRRRILEGDAPFGTILDEAGVPGENHPVAFFEVQPDAHMLADMDARGRAQPLFGRRNFIKTPDGRLIADVVEVLSPDSVEAR